MLEDSGCHGITNVYHSTIRVKERSLCLHIWIYAMNKADDWALREQIVTVKDKRTM